MKVLVLAQSAGIGGVESSLVNFVRYLVTKKHDVTVVFWRDAGPVVASLPAAVRIVDVQKGFARGLYRTGGIREVLRNPSAWARVKGAGFIALRSVLRRYRNPWVRLNRIGEDFDVAIAYRHEGYGPYYLVDQVRAAKKVMWYHHGEYKPSPMGESVDRSYFEKLDAVVAVSNSARSMLVERFPTLESSIRVIHNIIDEEEIRRKSLAASEPLWDSTRSTLLTVSRLSAEKGLDVSVRTAKILQERGVQFIWHVIGDGPERRNLEALIDALGVGDNFVLLGERTNPFPAMRQADLYVQTSRVEAHPLTIQEAMALGKPIVASNIPPIAAVLDDGRLGVLSDVTPEAFAEAIEALAVNSAARFEFADRLAKYRPPNERVFAEIDKLLAE